MDTLTLLYTFGNLVFCLAFIPQILTLAKDRSGATSTNLSTWTMFTFYAAATLAYAIFKNGDAVFIFSSSTCFVGDTAVLALALTRRFQHRTQLATVAY